MTIAEMHTFLDSVEAAIDPFMEKNDADVLRAAARAALQVLIDGGVVEINGQEEL